MASRKYRPIVMNRNRRPARTYGIFKRALSIFAIVAFIVVIVLAVIHYRKIGKAVVKTDAPTKQLVGEMKKKDSGFIVSGNQKEPEQIGIKEKGKAQQKDTVIEKVTAEIKNSAPEQTELTAKQVAIDTTSKKPLKPKEIELAKSVSEDKMFEILNQLKLKKLESDNVAKCVSIRIVNTSNAENGNMIAKFLRKNGYIISGREIVQGSQNGITIDAEGTCLRLVIGNL